MMYAQQTVIPPFQSLFLLSFLLFLEWLKDIPAIKTKYIVISFFHLKTSFIYMLVLVN